MSNSSIWPIDRTLLGATTLGQSELGSNSNEEVLHIPQSSSITEASPSDCLVLYPGHSLGGGVLPLCRDAVSAFYSPIWKGHMIQWFLFCYKEIGQAVRVFANGLGDLGSIPGQVIPKTQKMVLDASLLNTQHYKVRIKGKVEQSRGRSSTLPYTLV